MDTACERALGSGREVQTRYEECAVVQHALLQSASKGWIRLFSPCYFSSLMKRHRNTVSLIYNIFSFQNTSFWFPVS